MTSAPIRIRFRCNACSRRVTRPWSSEADQLACPHCGTPRPLTVSEALRVRRQVDLCPVCGGTELYYRKDFPQKPGSLVIAAAAVASFYFLYRRQMLLAWSVPLAALLIDALLYFVVPFATCCYRCGAEFVGARRHPDHRPFDLAAAEKYSHHPG